MRFVEAGVVILLCVLLTVHGERSERKRDRRRLRMKRCNCDNVMLKMTQMIDKKLLTLEQKIMKELSEKNMGPPQAPTKFKMMGHRLDKLGREVQGTKAIVQKQAVTLQHTRQFLYNRRDDTKTLEDKYSMLANTVQNLTVAVDYLERILTKDGPAQTTMAPMKPEEFPKDCDEVYRSGGMRFQGDYYIMIQPEGSAAPFKALCKVFNNSGWTVIQRRRDGSVDFFKTWKEYKRGFGSLEGEFWLGNDHIHHITSQGETQLRIQMQDWTGKDFQAAYDRFRIANEKNLYALHVRGYHGTAGDSMTSHWKTHDGKPFSTYDQDNDDRHFDSCARHYHGAWWFNNCFDSHLNGKYYRHGSHQNYFVRNGILWNGIHEYSSLKRVTMMVAPVHRQGRGNEI